MNIEVGFCQCGCGERAPIAGKAYIKRGVRAGEPFRFISGHQNRGRVHLHRRIPVLPNTTVFCACGCGKLTKVAKKTIRAVGDIKGQPRRFLRGHFFHTINGAGAESPAWKGGIRKHGGYIYFHLPEHPNADTDGYVAEHVVLAVKALGRPLKQGEHVHHANCVRDDNTPGNLVVCSAAFHRDLHYRLACMNAIGSPTTTRHCRGCGSPFAPPLEKVLAGVGYFCSRRCYNQRSCGKRGGSRQAKGGEHEN